MHTTQTLDELHQHMGHISPCAIKELVGKEIVTGLTLDSKSEAIFCDICMRAKPIRKPVLKEWTSPLAPNMADKVHSDVWGPATPCSYDGKDFFISFTDNHSWWSHVELMTHKSDMFTHYHAYEAWLQMQHGAKLKKLQTNHGGE